MIDQIRAHANHYRGLTPIAVYTVVGGQRTSMRLVSVVGKGTLFQLVTSLELVHLTRV